MKKTLAFFISFVVGIFFLQAQPVFQKSISATSNIIGSWADTASNGIIVAGSTVFAPTDGILMKTDLSGNISWTKTYGGTGDQVFHSVRMTSDGGYIAAGYTDGSGAGGKDALLVKTDASGTVTWSKSYGTIDDEIAYDVIQTSDGGYAFTGDAQKIAANNSVGAIYLVKLTSTGLVSWSKMGSTKKVGE